MTGDGAGDVINNYGVAWNDETPMEGYWIQKTILPSPSASQLGKVYQYIGETTDECTHNYFYECKEIGGVYHWQRVNVQPSGGGGGAAVWGEIGGDIADQTDLNTAFIRKSSFIPDSLEVSAPRRLTLGNLSHHFITPVLTPEGVAKNVIFQSDNNAVMVEPDGRIVILKKGISRVHVIPTMNTGIYKTVTVEVTEPSMRLVTASSIRLTSSGNLRFN